MDELKPIAGKKTWLIKGESSKNGLPPPSTRGLDSHVIQQSRAYAQTV